MRHFISLLAISSLTPILGRFAVRHFVVQFILLLGLILFGCHKQNNASGTTPETSAEEVEAHSHGIVFVMATCPYCANAMNLMLDVNEQVGDALPLTIAYVGPVDDMGNADLLYDENEVAAAEIQICTGMNSEKESWFTFLRCVYQNDNWKDLPSTWVPCAQEAGVAVDAVKTCVSDGEGKNQLKQSIEAAAHDGIESVPALFFDGERYGGPIDKDALLTHFCFLAGKEETRPELCEKAEKPSRVAARLLVDARCEQMAECDVQREMEYLQALMPNMKVTEVDYGEAAGLKLYEAILAADGPDTLPTLIIDSKLKEQPDVVKKVIGDYLMDFEDGYLMMLGDGFNPTREICDNQIDDNGDGNVDCADEQCGGYAVCREEAKNRLDLFVMSQCPFGMMMVPPVDHLIAHFKTHGSQAVVRFQFIGRELDGTLYSMHGPAEVTEDKRMLCVQDMYATDYQFMKYMMCRARNYKTDAWRDCLSEGMDGNAVAACVDGEKGSQLLQQSFRLANEADKGASPTWLLNNRYEMEGRQAPAILAAYCEKNADDPACKEEIEPLLIDGDADVPDAQCH